MRYTGLLAVLLTAFLSIVNISANLMWPWYIVMIPLWVLFIPLGFVMGCAAFLFFTSILILVVGFLVLLIEEAIDWSHEKLL